MCTKQILPVIFVSLLALANKAVAFPIKVDIGGGNLKSGWTRMPDAGYGNDGVVTVEGVTFTASCCLAGDEKWRNFSGGDLGGDYFDCDNGFGNPNGSIILTISNLAAGSYEFTSYHNNAEPSYRCPLDITVTGSDVSYATTAADVPVTQNTVDDDIGSGSVEFTTTGSADVVITFTPTCDNKPDGMMCLNGFILDRTGATVEFESASSGALEQVSPAVLIVNLSEAVSETVTVDYEVIGGTADGDGTDYTLADGTLTFIPDDTSETISISIVNDGADEEDETIIIELSNPTGGEVGLGAITQHTYTIIDPRPDVQFDSTTSSGDEDVTPANIAVSLSHAWSEMVTVEYEVIGGTATGNGVDYNLPAGTLTFDPCQTTRYISIDIVNDVNVEGPETIELSLSQPNNAKLGDTFLHIFTIDDDELRSTFTNSLGMEFILIMPGIFTMGEGDGHRIQDTGSLDYDEQPAHTVTISKPFYMLKTKVSQTHYQQSGLPGAPNDISWDDANSFAVWLSQEDGNSHHLPTEAQWEYVYENPGQVQDMSSREWVRDWHEPYGHDALTDSVGPVKGVLKVIRADGQNRWALPTNAKYQPWQLGEAQACSFRLVVEFDPPETPHVSPGPFCQAVVKQSTAPGLQGPDPDIPYFTVRFSMPIPPDNIDDGIASMLGCCPSTMHHSHSPGFEIMPNGDALAVWFTAHGSEYAQDVRFVQARLRYGSDQWDMPELFWDMKGMNDESGLLWSEDDGTVHFFGGGRIANSDRRPFVMAVSNDSGASWTLKRPNFPVPAVNYQAQPCQNAWRQNGNTIYTVTDGENPGDSSIVWRSLDNGVTWYDMGGRTNGRHSTIVPIGNSGTLLSLGGKNSNIGGWMPWCKSYNWGATWPDEGPTCFAFLDGNQRPCVTRLANGKLVFVEDCQERGDNDQPPGWTHGYGCLIAISDNNGVSWHIKNLPVTLPHESDLDYGTLGYSTIRQAPNGVIHILTTMTHPCLHYELNEAWIYSEEGDIPPETTGGTVNDYNEYYPSSPLKATWSARTCPNGRYLLHGTETSYYEDGTKEYEVTYKNGRKDGTETFWAPDGTKLWSWEHDDGNNVSVWTHYWSNGLKRIESTWNSYPTPRDLPSRNFSGFVADGNSYHWGLCGQPAEAYDFNDGEYQGVTNLPEPQTNIIADITGDCSVDFNDLGKLSDDWLAGELIYPVGPNNALLVLHYDFNEASGTTLADSTGNGYTGTFFTDVGQTPAEISGRMDQGRSGNSFHFWPGLATGGISMPNNVFVDNNITQEITVAVWIKNAHPGETPDSAAFMWEFREWDDVSTSGGNRVLAVETTDRNGNFEFHDDSQNTAISIDWSAHTEWKHYGFVRDAAKLRIYVDGRLKSEDNASGNPMAVPGLLYVGVAADRAPGNVSGLHDGFTGNMEDWKIYSYALSQEEIMSLAETGPVNIGEESPANLDGSGLVNFIDYAILASQWLMHWP